MKTSTKGTGQKFKVWTEKENNALKDAFFKYSNNFKSGKNGATISRIQRDLNLRGIIRTQMGINRRLSRLGLTFYKVKNDNALLKCPICKGSFMAYLKTIKRKKHTQKLCLKCQKVKNREWDLLHREEKLKYYRDYYKRSLKNG